MKFPARPGLSLRFCTDTVGEEGIAHYPPLLERDAKGWTLRRLQGAARLRARERRVGPFAGQELVKQVVDLGGGQLSHQSFAGHRPGDGQGLYGL